MLRFYRNIAGVMRFSVKHPLILLPSRIEEYRLSLKQILNGKRRVSICVKSIDCLKGKQPVSRYIRGLHNTLLK